MKALKQLSLGVLLLLLPFVGGCDAMLDVDSERYNFEEDARMQSLHDTLYNIVGVFSEMQKLGDRYVLLGELRADLMKVTDDASIDMKEIYYFNMSPDNEYADMKTYYSIINQCNYIIHYADTAYTEKSDKPLMRIYSSAKSIRAWTYMQLALNYGTIPFSEQPILSVKDAEQDFPLVSMDNLFSYLIADLLPLKDEQMMSPGIFGNFNASRSIFPIPLLLGDLYLWKGEYANAAAMYYELIFEQNLIINSNYTNQWGVENNAINMNSLSWSWFNSIMMQNNEVVSALGAFPNYGQRFTLDSLSAQEKIMPSQVALDKWLNALYYLNASSTKNGDLRILDAINPSYFIVKSGLVTVEDEYLQLIRPFIGKYAYMSQSLSEDDPRHLPLYRCSHIYLRYAEAINRLGYSQLAFAVMKNGLKTETMTLPHIVAEMAQTDTIIPSFLAFNFARFTDNTGTRMRGCGNVHQDDSYFIIPDSMTMVLQAYSNYGPAPTKQDTIDYVEDVLLQEMAMELAFEGNRFHDLMRFAMRRGDAYLADRVAEKYDPAEQAAIRAKLLDQQNWFIPQE